MADLDKIKVRKTNTTYSIADSTARADIDTITNAVDGIIRKIDPVASSNNQLIANSRLQAFKDEVNSVIPSEASNINLLVTQEALNTKMTTSTYDSNGNGIVDNAEKVGGHSVDKDVPSDAKFTDTIYDDTELRGMVGDLSALDTDDTSDLVSAINELVGDFDSVDEEVEKLDAFSGSETILDSSGGEILDSSNNRILDTQVGASGVVVALRNVLTWFKTNASHLVQDSGYTVNKATYELINS